MCAVGATPVPELEARVRAQVQTVTEAMRPWQSPQDYLNFAETTRDPDAFWNEPAYDRLRAIKADVDPDELIRSNHPVPASR